MKVEPGKIGGFFEVTDELQMNGMFTGDVAVKSGVASYFEILCYGFMLLVMVMFNLIGSA